ncbi:hypothetical protein BC831DRAFT_151622 [Entophlyctis helioformis]|nr:hypothetical protein BC831DRAFT_151622 [Entophlyctis helioformis]
MFSLAQFGVIHVAAFTQFGLDHPAMGHFTNPSIFSAKEQPPALAEVRAADGIAADNSRYRVEQQIGALAVGVPLPRRIITRLNQHARTHQAAAWRAVMLALNTFWHKIEAAPDVSCHFLNTGIFKAVLESLDPLVGVSAKDCLDRYRASFDARQPDIAACLRNPLRRTDANVTAALLESLHCPFFLAEVSGTRVTSADNHRDFDRLARNMTMCMLVWLGVLRHAPVAERAHCASMAL